MPSAAVTPCRRPLPSHQLGPVRRILWPIGDVRDRSGSSATGWPCIIRPRQQRIVREAQSGGSAPWILSRFVLLIWSLGRRAARGDDVVDRIGDGRERDSRSRTPRGRRPRDPPRTAVRSGCGSAESHHSRPAIDSAAPRNPLPCRRSGRPWSSLPMIAGERPRREPDTTGRQACEPARRWSAVRPPRSPGFDRHPAPNPIASPAIPRGQVLVARMHQHQGPQLVRDREEPVELLVGEFAAADLGGDLHPRKPGRPCTGVARRPQDPGPVNAIAPSAANRVGCSATSRAKKSFCAAEFPPPRQDRPRSRRSPGSADHLHRNAVAVHVGHTGIRRPAAVVDLPVAPVTVVQPSVFSSVRSTLGQRSRL